ncbi:MAG: YabP/YqfC family sporulation protein [Alicyclobacillus macrosporangiidus]|uniref:YabP/YqfC family sporulation protein n=1 Tax=Alicyclobacillus macrosporangiidus TaxID=392015 RepID=UPI0026EF7267|nr:YabP/YqfC family sporulation protein [Alicyclobacillus macrosporangiidus]MCL6599149.1 YabP/YqfC family sporulation protein [Alicyclobacillus macrosporangiidus]
MHGWKRRIQRTVTDLLALPQDALQRVARLTCVGGQEVVVEQAVSLLRVGEKEVEIDLGETTVLLEGDAFTVQLVASGEVHVSGRVDRITYRRPQPPHQGGRR